MDSIFNLLLVKYVTRVQISTGRESMNYEKYSGPMMSVVMLIYEKFSGLPLHPFNGIRERISGRSLGGIAVNCVKSERISGVFGQLGGNYY